MCKATWKHTYVSADKNSGFWIKKRFPLKIIKLEIKNIEATFLPEPDNVMRF